MYNINIFEYIQDMCLLHYNIIQWDSEESQLTYEVRLQFVLKVGAWRLLSVDGSIVVNCVIFLCSGFRMPFVLIFLLGQTN